MQAGHPFGGNTEDDSSQATIDDPVQAVRTGNSKSEGASTIFAFDSAGSACPPAASRAVRSPTDNHGTSGRGAGPFSISDVVARIDAFQRERVQRKPAAAPFRPVDSFRFDTDLCGVIRRVRGINRAPLIGLSLDFAGSPDMSRVDGVASGAFRQRSRFSNARLVVEGDSEAAGDWLISGIPCFDVDSGRFTGYRGSARRPRRDERAGPPPMRPTRAFAQQLRQLVHELRTPAGAISGFAEMIEEQYLGAVPDIYRERAGVIRQEARQLLGVIEDLDFAARIDDEALDLRPQTVALRPLFDEIVEELAPLMALREAKLVVPETELVVLGDARAVRRLFSRLTATLIALCLPGEWIAPIIEPIGSGQVALRFNRPAQLRMGGGDALIDDEDIEDLATLGTGFALRLSRNLARELGGALLFGKNSLTLRLRRDETQETERVRNS